MEDFYTLAEIAVIIGRSEKSVSRYFRQGKLKGIKVGDNGRQLIKVTKENFKKFLNDYSEKLGLNISPEKTQEENRKEEAPKASPEEKSLYITKENLKEAFKELVTDQQLQLMKPIEEQSIFIAGTLTKENQFLKERLETVVQENTILRESIKALPGPVEEITEKLSILQEKNEELKEKMTESEKNLNKLKTEKEKLQKEEEEEKNKLKEEAEKEKIKIQTEKEKIKKEAEELKAGLEKKLKEEKKLKTQLEEKNKQEEELKNKLKKEEEEKLHLIEVWKKELEEERNKTWWQKLLGK